MDIVDIRRENLRRWVAQNGTPMKEKSLFSQLKATGSFGERVARRLEEQYNMGAMYLDQPLESTGASFPSRQVVIAEPDNPSLISIKRVKLKLSAGIMGFAVEPDRRDGGMATVPRRWVEQNDFIPERLLAMEVKGESMEPALYAGDTVIVNTADTRPVDGAVYAINYEGEPVIKRLVRDSGIWWLASDHSDQRKYSRKRCEGDMCIIVGRVVRKESERI